MNHDTNDWGSAEDEGSPAIKRSGPAYESDQHFYRVVAWSLSITVILSMLGSLGLASLDKSVPDPIIALGSTAVGALAGVLVGSKR
jgi:hypothetical protein